MSSDSGPANQRRTRTRSVDDILTQWAEAYTEVDAAPMGIIGRIWRLSRYLEQAVQHRLDDFGCSLPEFDVLATLRRSGAPYSLTAGELMHSAMVTSGAVTNRVDRLVARGWVTRDADPENRRVRRISLTPEGLDLVNRIVPAHVENERQMLAVLSDEEQKALEGLLAKLAGTYEQPRRRMP